jgi:hypothetical protein
VLSQPDRKLIEKALQHDRDLWNWAKSTLPPKMPPE